MSAPRIDTTMTQHVAHSPVHGDLAPVKRSVFARDTLEVLQQNDKKKEAEGKKAEEARPVATKEESTFLGNCAWLATRPFVWTAEAVSYVWTNVICCGWFSSSEKTAEVGPEKVEKPKKAKEIEDVEDDADVDDVEDADDNRFTSYRSKTDDFTRAALRGNLTKLDEYRDNSSDATQQRMNVLGWEVARENGAFTKPLDKFNVDAFVDGLNKEGRANFWKAVGMKQRALAVAESFRKEVANITIDGRKQERAQDQIDKVVKKFEKLGTDARKYPQGAEGQKLLLDVGYLAHGGRRSFGWKNEAMVTAPQKNAGRGYVMANPGDVTETVLPLDKAFTKMLDRVLKNNGCIFENNGKGDKARIAIAEFANEVADFAALSDKPSAVDLQEAVTTIHGAYSTLKESSPTAARVLEEVVGNFFKANGQEKLSAATMLPRDVRAIVNCAQLIDGFENHGDMFVHAADHADGSGEAAADDEAPVDAPASREASPSRVVPLDARASRSAAPAERATARAARA